jgi:hypothetical protein
MKKLIYIILAAFVLASVSSVNAASLTKHQKHHLVKKAARHAAVKHHKARLAKVHHHKLA